MDQRVYRKLEENLTWDTVYKFIAPTDSTFSDTILTGSSFEYRFEKDTGFDGSTLYGYIHAGHKVPAITDRGIILLAIDSTNKTYLDTSIRTFRNDLTGDGWRTRVKWFSPSSTVSDIKTYIVNAYNAEPDVKSVVLIGDLAVPYSGDYSSSGDFPPDGHTTGNPPSHEGAWPADCYYGDIYSSSWTDASVTNNLGARTANNNNPGDGKFDQTTIPNLITLQVGRIDLSNMSTFTKTERELLRQYFTKNHNFRHKLVNINERCLIDDNFGLLNYSYPNFDESFGNNAYGNMAPLISDTATKALDYLTTLNNSSYLWSFGMGNGGYSSCTGVANTNGFASNQIKSVFTGLFGSFFGDWDNANNLLRAPLASSGNVLNSFWTGRPHWFFHHMGLGQTIGYSTLRTQNNFDTVIAYYLYPTFAFSYLQVHIGLMGDPSVRMQPVVPANNLAIKQDSCSNGFLLNWQASTDTAVHEYYIFRAKHIDSNFTLLGTTLNLAYKDNLPLTGDNIYMVRASKLQVSGSGTYYNLSQGIFDTINTSVLRNPPLVNAGTDTTLCRNNYVKIGKVSANTSTIYNWIPATALSDTVTIKAISSGNRILLATDTLSKCTIRDTMLLTVTGPISETISKTLINVCGDTAIWSSTLNNGHGFNYSWTFEHGTPDTSGYRLNNPGLIAYDTIGNFRTILTVQDTLSLCTHKDTVIHAVNCLVALPIAEYLFSCQDLNNGMTQITLINKNVSAFSGLYIEGLNVESQWIKLFSINAKTTNANVFMVESGKYRNIRLSGEKSNGKMLVLDVCSNKYTNYNNFVFPIPVENRLNINTDYYANYSITYKVYNSYGQEVILPLLSKTNSLITLNTSGIAAGNYVIIIMVDDVIKQVKFNKI